MELSKDKKMILGGLAIFVIGVVGYYIMQKTSFSSEEYNIQLENFVNTTAEQIIEKDEKKKIIVHVAGQVRDEGIIEIEEGDRVADAIEEAGGLLDDADLSNINLAYILSDGQKIYIPSIYDEQEREEGNSLNSGIVGNNQTTNNSKININTATQSQLQSITGIGPSTAKNIIKYRQENGQFSSIEEIMEVSGIGEAKFASIEDEITV